MSMGQLLTTIRDHLRTQLTLGVNQCGVQINGLPPAAAGEKYVAIDDGGTEQRSGDEPFLTERYKIVIAIMRRAGVYPADRQGDLLVRETSSIQSLEELERGVIKQIHGSQSLRVTYNTALGVPDASLGEIAIMPLFYRGRGRTYIYTSPVESADQLHGWFRRDLNFSGMDRKQKLENMG